MTTLQCRTKSNHLAELQKTEWRSLSDRRNDAKLCVLYQITNALVGTPTKTYLIPLNTVTRKHKSLFYLIPHSKCNYHVYSLSPSTIRLWNSLTQVSKCCKSKQPLTTLSRLSIFPLFRHNISPYKNNNILL